MNGAAAICREILSCWKKRDWGVCYLCVKRELALTDRWYSNLLVPWKPAKHYFLDPFRFNSSVELL